MGGTQRITVRQVVYLQVQRRKNGIGDELWTDMKRSVGAASTKDLTQRQMNALLARMGEAGSVGQAQGPGQAQGSKGQAQGPAPTTDALATSVGADPSGRPSDAPRGRQSQNQRGGRVGQWTPSQHKMRMIAKIEAVLGELQLPMSYADGIARQMFGADSLLFCDGDQTFRVLQGLMVYHKRQLGRRAAGTKGGVK